MEKKRDIFFLTLLWFGSMVFIALWAKPQPKTITPPMVPEGFRASQIELSSSIVPKNYEIGNYIVNIENRTNVYSVKVEENDRTVCRELISDLNPHLNCEGLDLEFTRSNGRTWIIYPAGWTIDERIKD